MFLLLAACDDIDLRLDDHEDADVDTDTDADTDTDVDTTVTWGPRLWSAAGPSLLLERLDVLAAGLFLTDVDGDGREDLAYVDWITTDNLQRVTVWLRSRDGLGDPVPQVLPANLSRSAMGDVTGDGRADLVGWTYTELLLFAGSDEGFLAPVVVDAPSGTEASGRIGLVDLTGDGVLDIITSSYVWPGATYTLHSARDGEVDLLATLEMVSEYPSLVDFTAYPLSADEDVALFSEFRIQHRTARYFRYTGGALVLEELGDSRTLDDGATKSMVLDVNEDGALDLLTTGWVGLESRDGVTGAISILREGAPDTDQPCTASAVDLDGDGTRDVLELIRHYEITETSWAERTWLQPALARDASVEVLPHVEVAAAPNCLDFASPSMVAADMNADGCADVVWVDAVLEPWIIHGVCTPDPS